MKLMKTNRTPAPGASRPARRIAALVAAAWFASTSANAAINLATGFTDLWWNHEESGWGVNIDHQNQRMYLTFYIYRADGSPYWVTALLTYVAGSQFTFTGDLYENPNGPWFGGPFTPLPTGRKAGAATFTSADGLTAKLDYNVNGVPVSKSIERVFLQNLDFSGVYDGTTNYVTDSCTPSTLNGQVAKDNGKVTITQLAPAIKIVVQGSSSTCTLNGTYAQTGLVGTATGDYTCTDGTFGTFRFDYMQRTILGMTAQISGKNQQCSFEGGIGVLTAD